jgi:hypothetical protein
MDFVSEKRNISKEKIDFNSFSLEEQRKLVGAFVWLVEQDKKQNPSLYQINKKENYD